MPTKRAQVTGNPYGQRPSAIEKLTGGAALDEGGASSSGALADANLGTPSSNGTTVIPQNGTAGPGATTTEQTAPEKPEKVTFYLSREHVEKLDELVFAHNRQSKQRINRNAIVRHLIDQATLDDLRGLEKGG